MTSLTQRGARASAPARLPALPASTASDPQRRAFEEAVREWLEVRMGGRGDFFERAVTFRDLVPQVEELTNRLESLETARSTDNSATVASLQAQVNSLQIAVRNLASALQAEADNARFNLLATEKKLANSQEGGLDASLVTLTASAQVFIKAANGGTVSPATITLTATIQNVENPVYEWLVDGVVVPGASGSTLSVAPFATGTAKTYRCNVTGDGNVDVFDVLSVFSLQEGSEALAAGLENENRTIQCSYIGTPVTGSFPVTSTMVVARGAAFLAHPDVSFSVVESTGIESAGTTTGPSANVSINSQTGAISIGKITSNYASATFRASVGTATVNKRLTMNKSLNGGDGSSAQTLMLTSTGFAFIYPDAQSVDATAPDRIEFTAALQNISGTVTFSASGRNAAGTEITTPTLTDVTSTSCALTKANFASSTNVRYVRVTASIAGTNGTLTDYITIYRGDNGVDSLQVVLSNEAHVLAANSAGTVTNYNGSGTTVRVFQGLDELIYDGVGTTAGRWAVSALGSGISPSSPTATVQPSGVTCATYPPHANMSTPNATVTYTVTGRSRANTAFSLTKVQSFSRSDAGATGTRGSLIASAYGPPYNLNSPAVDPQWSNLIANRVIWKVLQNSPSAEPADSGSTAHLRIGDTVTQSNGTTWSQTRYWTGSVWAEPGTVLSGNLLVGGTISGQVNLNITGSAAFEGSNGISLADPDADGPTASPTTRTAALVANTSNAREVGVYGSSASNNGAGVAGVNTNSGGGVGVYGNGYVGVEGRGALYGVRGSGGGSSTVGVRGENGGSGTAIEAVYQTSWLGVGSGGYAIKATGPMTISGPITSTVPTPGSGAPTAPLVLPRLTSKPTPIVGGVALHASYGIIVSDGTNWYAPGTTIIVP